LILLRAHQLLLRRAVMALEGNTRTTCVESGTELLAPELDVAPRESASNSLRCASTLWLSAACSGGVAWPSSIDARTRSSIS